jgi:hypothetical protein
MFIRGSEPSCIAREALVAALKALTTAAAARGAPKPRAASPHDSDTNETLIAPKNLKLLKYQLILAALDCLSSAL